MASPDPFGDLMRGRGADPSTSRPMAQPHLEKAEGDARVSQAEGNIAPRKVAADVENTEARTGNTQEGTRLTGARADAQEQKNIAATGPAAQRAAMAARLSDLESTRTFLENIQRARNAISGRSTGITGQLTQGLWGSPAADLGSALEAIVGKEIIDTIQKLKAASASGATGFGSLTEREGNYLASQLGSLRQKQSPEQLLKTLNNIETSYRKFIAYSSGQNPDTPEGAYWAGLVAPGKETEGLRVTDSGDYRWEADPALRGLNNTVVDMIKAGRSEAQIKDWLTQINPEYGRTTDIQTNIDLWKAGGEPRVNIEGKWVPKGFVGKLTAGATETPAGAYLLGAGDALTAGTFDNMTGNPAMTRSMMEQSREEHPTANVVGQLGGGMLAAATGEGLLARGGIQLSPWVVDAALSGAYGAGSADDGGSRIDDALLSAGVGTLGGAAVRGGARGVGRVARGAGNRAADLLAKYDIPMTVGQILPGAVRNFEERATSLPGIGGAIRSRRREGLEAFNKAAFGHALEPIGVAHDGVVGQNGIAAARDAVSQAYAAALDGTQIVLDEGFENGLAQAAMRNVHKVPTIGPEVDAELRRIIGAYVKPQGLTGAEFQAARQELRELRNTYAGKRVPGWRAVTPAIDDVESSMLGAFERQNPGHLDDYLRADEAFKRTSILGDAVDMAPAKDEGIFSPAGLQRQSRTSTRKFSGAWASRTGQRPFNDLTAAGASVLPSGLPDSGTAGRLMLPLTVGALTGGGAYGASGESQRNRNGDMEVTDRNISGSTILGGLAALAAAAPYSRAGQRMAQYALLGKRSPNAIVLGDMLSRYAPQAGHAAAVPFADMTTERVPNPQVRPEDIVVNTDVIDRAIRLQRKMLEREGPQAVGRELGFPQLGDEGPIEGEELP